MTGDGYPATDDIVGDVEQAQGRAEIVGREAEVSPFGFAAKLQRELMAIDKARVDSRGLPVVALSREVSGKIANLSVRPKDQMAETGIDQQWRIFGGMLRQAVVGAVQPMGQIELRAVKLDAPAPVCSAGHVTCDVVITDHKPANVDALDLLSVRHQRKREISIEPCRFHLDLAQPRDPLVREFEDEPSGARSIGCFGPTGLVNGQACRAKVEAGVGLSAARFEGRIRQVNADESADPVGQIVEGKPAALFVIKRQRDPVSGTLAVLRSEEHAAVYAYRDVVESCFALQAHARPADVEHEVAVAEVAVHR